MSTTPNVPEEHGTYIQEPAGTPRWIIVVFVVAFALMGYLAYAGYSARTQLQTALEQSNSNAAVMTAEVDQTNARLADLRGQLEVTTQKLGLTESELAQARTLGQTIRKDQLASDQKLASQIGQVQNDANAKIGAVSADLGTAKSDIDATKKDLEATKGKLTSTIGDLGVQSGLIARNQEELDVLKHSGERNIFEFNLAKTKAPQHVGPILLRLTKTDAKKYKYTMIVVADDKSIEKKDRNADEPLQFYVRGVPHPYEIVVFDVGKDKVTGYLSTPKDAAAATPTPPAKQ